jgi:methylase of polypeptide subunit release factors
VSVANETTGAMDFEALYGDAESTDGLIPWDIGGPQPVVQQLVAYGAVRGEVLDPGTGPGYHAIHYASQGLSATGIDGSASAVELARRNAERAGWIYLQLSCPHVLTRL